MATTGANDHRLLLWRGGSWIDITEQIGGLQSTDELNTLSVEVAFTLGGNPLDKYVPKRDIHVGDKIRIISAATDGAEIFSGVITEESLDFTYTAHDLGWYLGKSQLFFQVSGARADVSIRQLCTRAGVTLGNVPDMPQIITQAYIGDTFAAILEDILKHVTTATGRQFLYRIEGGKLWIRDMPTEVITVRHQPAANVAPFDPTWALGQISGKRSLDALTNAVVVVKDDNNTAYVVAQASNAASITAYGRLQTIVSMTDDMSSSPAQIAKTTLAQGDRLTGEYQVSEMFGDDNVKSGRVIQFSSAAFGLAGKFRVKRVTHTYGHPHKMSLDIEPIDANRAAGNLDMIAGSTAALPTSAGGGTAAALVSTATAEIGTAESPIGSNNQKYGAWFGSNGVPWCAIFISWCANQTHVAYTIMPHGFASVTEYQSWYQQRGQYRSISSGYIPQAGDLMVQKSAGASHMGIVETADSSGFTAIEGNSSNQVRRVRYDYTDAKLTGFCTPRW